MCIHFSGASETPQVMLPFRFLQYHVSLMEKHLEQGNKRLPIIINLCLYAGKRSPYPYATDLYHCFEVPDLASNEVLGSLVFKPVQLVDLTVVSQEALSRHGKADLLEMLLKQAVCKDVLQWIKSNQEWVASLLKRSYSISGITYILAVDKKNEPELLIEAIIQAAPDKKDIVMTAAQKLRQQGRKEGMQQGMQTEKLTIARNMLLKLHLDMDIIQKATGLTQEGLELLLKEGDVHSLH